MSRRVLFCLLLAACSESKTSPPMRTDGGPRVIDPSVFDCRATMPPERVSTTPPECLRNPACRTRQVAGHRGAGGSLGRVAPEDTLSGYRAAIAHGADYVETDPRPTMDGVIVNMHDDTVDRTTDGTGKVDEMTFAQVRALRIEAGEFAGDYTCEQVPTLKEILETCKGRAMVLVDANKTNQVEALVAAIHEADALEWAIFDTSDVGKIDQALRIEPRLMIQIRIDSVREMRAQLDHFAENFPVIIETHDSNELVATATTAEALGGRLLVDVFVQDLASGLDGDLTRYQMMYDRGATILQTDRPELVLQSLGR